MKRIVHCSPARSAFYNSLVRVVRVGYVISAFKFSKEDFHSNEDDKNENINEEEHHSDQDFNAESGCNCDSKEPWYFKVNDIPGILRPYTGATQVSYQIWHTPFYLNCKTFCSSKTETPSLHSTYFSAPFKTVIKVRWREYDDRNKDLKDPVGALLRAFDADLRSFGILRISSLESDMSTVQAALDDSQLNTLLNLKNLDISRRYGRDRYPKEPNDRCIAITNDALHLVASEHLRHLKSLELRSTTTVELLQTIASSSQGLEKLVIHAPTYQRPGTRQGPGDTGVDWIRGLHALASCSQLRVIHAAFDLRQDLESAMKPCTTGNLGQPVFTELKSLQLCINEPVPNDIVFVRTRARLIPQACETPLVVCSLECQSESSGFSSSSYRTNHHSYKDQLLLPDAYERACTVFHTVTTDTDPYGPIFYESIPLAALDLGVHQYFTWNDEKQLHLAAQVWRDHIRQVSQDIATWQERGTGEICTVDACFPCSHPSQ